MKYAASTVLSEDWVPAVRARLPYFHAFELACSEPRIVAGPSEARRLLELKRRHALEYSLHSPFRRLDIASSDRKLRELTLSLCTRALEMAARVEARVCVVHPAQARLDEWKEWSEAERSRTRAREADGVRRLCETGGRLGVRVAVENMPRDRVSRDAAWLAGLARAVAHPSLGFTLDVGHAHTSGIPPALFLARLGADLIHVHVHDNSGARDEHRAVGEGSIDWRSIAEALVGSGYSGLVADEALDLASQLRGRAHLDFLCDLAGRVRVRAPSPPA